MKTIQFLIPDEGTRKFYTLTDFKYFQRVGYIRIGVYQSAVLFVGEEVIPSWNEYVIANSDGYNAKTFTICRQFS